MEASGGAPNFEIEVVTYSETSVVAVFGELDLATTPRLREKLEEGQGLSLVLDLCGCTFMDSSGLALIVEHASEARGAFAVACLPDGPADRLFRLVGADAVVPIYSSRDEAVAALAEETPSVA